MSDETQSAANPPPSLITQMRAIYNALQLVPDWYEQALLNDQIDPDNRSLTYHSDEGGRRVLGSLGNVRAMARVVAGVRAISELLLEDEGPPLTLPSSFLEEIAVRIRHDTLALVKANLDAGIAMAADHHTDAIEGLNGARIMVSMLMEGKLP